MATSYDRWEKDPFFLAAEEVQESADRCVRRSLASRSLGGFRRGFASRSRGSVANISRFF
jgi:hypothetical protein